MSKRKQSQASVVSNTEQNSVSSEGNVEEASMPTTPERRIQNQTDLLDIGTLRKVQATMLELQKSSMKRDGIVDPTDEEVIDSSHSLSCLNILFEGIIASMERSEKRESESELYN